MSFCLGSDHHLGNYHMSNGKHPFCMVTNLPARTLFNLLEKWQLELVHCQCTVSSLNQHSWPGKSKRFPVLLLFCVKGIFIKLDPWAAASCTNVLQWHRFRAQMYHFFQTALLSLMKFPELSQIYHYP